VKDPLGKREIQRERERETERDKEEESNAFHVS